MASYPAPPRPPLGSVGRRRRGKGRGGVVDSLLWPLVSGSHFRCWSCLRCTVYGLFWELLQEWFPYATLLGSTVDTCLCQSSRLSGIISHFFFVKRWITDPEVDSRLSGVSAASPEEYLIWIFLLVFLWKMTSGLSPYSVLSLVRQRIHALRQSI